MPEMMVWPDSSSVCTRNDGSSCARRFSATPIFSWSTLVFGSTACEITGSGNSIFSSVIDFFTSQMVSPVMTSFSPTTAAMSPARTSLISARSLACICSRRPMRSFLPRTEVSTVSPELQHAGIHADERQLADERVGHDLERERGERLVVDRLARIRLAPVVLALHRRDVHGRRQVVDHRVQHRLHALVLERGAAQHRHDLVVDGAQAQALLDLLDRKLVRLEVLVHQLFIGLGGGLDHLLAPFLRLGDELGRDLLASRTSCPGRLRPSRSPSS